MSLSINILSILTAFPLLTKQVILYGVCNVKRNLYAKGGST